MYRRKYQRAKQLLSFLLAFLLVVGDGSTLQVLAAGSVSGSDAVVMDAMAEEQEDPTDETGEADAGDISASVSGNETESADEAETDSTLTEESNTEEAEEMPSVSDGNIPLREPQDFYPEPEPENYGTLVDYDEYSRTYHVDGDSYVTVIGNDASTYIDEEGELAQVDNTLIENPVSTFGGFRAGKSYVNSANDFMVQLEGEVSVSGGDLFSVAAGDYAITMAPTEGNFTQSVVKDNAIRYNDVFEGIDYQYTILSDSVKEDIILLNPVEKNSFSYRLNTYGLSTALIRNVLYVYEEGCDPQTEAVFVFDAPLMVDAAGEISFGLSMQAETLTDEWGDVQTLVTVTADEEWLSAPERVYPVRIDPSAIQVDGEAIRIACAEEGSPNTVIGDNGYPYVGYDDGVKSGNLKQYGTAHLNCNSYFAIDYDFSALSEEAEIVSATFEVTQLTRWSKGASTFGLFGVGQAWEVGSLTWNNQPTDHYGLGYQQAATIAGEPLSYDVTEEVSAWINGVKENNGFVMKAELPTAGEAGAATGATTQCEVLYNNEGTYPPRLVLSWTGELTDLSSLTLDDTTIQIYPVVARSDDKSTNVLGVVAHGLAKPGSTVHYSLVNGATGETVAQESLIYPDSALYANQFSEAMEYKRRLSNWQSEVFAGLTPGQVYYIQAYAEDETGTGAVVTSETFLIYKEGAFDLLPRIASHYGVDINTIMADMRMQDCLTRENNLIFIRSPKNTSAYVAGELSEYYKAAIDGLLLGRAENCEFGYEPINLNTGNFYMEQTDASIADIGGDFTLGRQYNSKGAAYSGGLGYGWTFTYDERMGELADGSILWMQSNGCILTFTRGANGYTAPAGQDYTLAETEEGYSVTDLATGEQHLFNAYGLLIAVVDVYGNQTTLTYDMNFHLQNITSPSGKVFTVALDGKERIASVALPDGYGISYSYDEAGNLVTVTDQAGDTIRFVYDGNHYMTAWYDENGNCVVENVYDSEGRVTRQADAEGAVVTLSYEKTAEGGQTTTTDAEGNVTIYTYDNQYRTTAIDYPDGTGEKRTYNEAGYVASITDRVGAVTTYTYDGKGNVLSETRQDGTNRTFTYNARNQITGMTDYDGGVTTYTYDGQNRPVTITDAEGNVTTYAYDGLNRLTAVTDPEGNTTTYAYEGACVVSMTDTLGNTWRYTYDAMNRQLTTTNPLGQTSSVSYDVKGRAVKETDGEGHTTTYTFDAAGVVTAITDKEGRKSTFTYDRMNRMLGGTDPLGNTLSYTYDKNGNKLTETDAEGLTVSYTYDAMNRLNTVTDAEGGQTTYIYNGDDEATSVTDRRGYTTSAVYDPVKKVVTSETDAEGNVTSYDIDSMGRITKVTYADGSSISYTWDKLSRMTSTTNQLGTTTYLTYDGNGNVLTIKDGEDRIYSYAYDALNRLVQTTDPLGGKVTYTYDAAGNLKAVTDERGNTTSYEYDAIGLLTAMRDACGGETTYTYDKEGRVLKLTAPEGDSITYTYDAIGQLTAQTDALGNTTSYTYDGISRLTAQIDALQGETLYTYDGNGNVTSVTDAMNNTHTYDTDEEGNLLSDTYPNGEKESYTYDGCGNVLTYTDRYGIVTTFTYDAMGRILTASDTAGNEMSYTYDVAGNLLTQTDVLGRSASYKYDAYGRAVAVTGVDGVTTTYEYDALDRLVKIIDGEGKVTAYEYDGAGNLIHTTEPGEAEYAYTYDALNRLMNKVDPEGAATTFVYDLNSNLTKVTDGNGVETAYAYDVLNRLSIYTDGNGGETAYTYDALSRLTEITTPEGTGETYSYDKVGNLLSVTDGLDKTTRYTYDDLYRLVRVKSPMGAVENYSYDSHDIVTSVTDALGNKTVYEVNDNGQVTTRTEANGGQYTYTYDAVQRLTGITTPLGYETAFTYSAGDDILTESDSLGRVSTYEYDIMHRLTKYTDPEGGVSTFDYDVRDNMSKVTNALGYSYSFAYDKVDRLTTVIDPEEKATELIYDMVGNITEVTTPGERTTSYGYDNNYNTVSVTDPMGYVYGYSYDTDDRLVGTVDPLAQTQKYTYDAANRLTAYTDKMGLTESYAYDAHGNVLSRTATDGLITTYTYDLKDRLTSVTDPMGSTAYYTWDEMDNLTGVVDYLGRGTTYTYDIEGNLTSITDASGRTETMTYDVASRITSYTSNGGNRITYDYDKLDNLVEKAYQNAQGEITAEPVAYAYDALGQRVNMYDSTGDTEYTYDGLGRITSVTTYRVPEREERECDGKDREEKDCEGKTDSDEIKAVDTDTERTFSHEERFADTVGYTYDEANNLSAITYPDGTQVRYEYDLNDNLIKVTDREGLETTYVYDALNRITEIHRPNGISTYNTYNARNQITELTNVCDDCEWIVSSYSYTYDDRGYIVAETSIEALADSDWEGMHYDGHGRYCDGKDHDGYCGVYDYCGKWNCKEHGDYKGNHEDDYGGKGQNAKTIDYSNDNSRVECTVSGSDSAEPACKPDAEPTVSGNDLGTTDCKGDGKNDCEYDENDCHHHQHGHGHCGRHAWPHCIAVKTDRTFTYDDAGKLLTSTEAIGDCYRRTYTYEYDLMGNRIALTVTDGKERVVERHKYTYNDSNQLMSELSYENGHASMLYYTYDADGNRISETEKVCGRYNVGVRNVTTYKYDVENRLAAVYDGCSLLMAAAYDGDGNRVFQLNYNPYDEEHWGCGYRCGEDHDHDDFHVQDKPQGNHESKGNCGEADSGRGKNDRTHGDSDSYGVNAGSRTVDSQSNNSTVYGTRSTNGSDSNEDRDASTNRDADSTESSDKRHDDEWENDSHNRCDILFPIDDGRGRDHHGLIDDIKSTGRHSNYELIEYINDVNREYTEVLVEETYGGRTDTSYIYGVDRLSFDYCNGHSGYYLYDPRGSVTGITNEWGDLVQSYRYDAFGNITFGAPTFENEYTYNGESYNPNIESQYLRARYYDVVNGNFLTEDSYLGSISEPLTLNRYTYCIASPTNYQDPSGYAIETLFDIAAVGFSIYEVAKDPSPENWGWLALDVVSVFVPFLAGSYVFKTIGKFVKTMDKFDIVGDMMKFGDKVAGLVDKAASLGKSFGDELAKLAKEAIETAAEKCGGVAKDILTKATTFLTKTIPDVIALIDKKSDCIDNFLQSKVDEFVGLFGKADNAAGTLTDAARAADESSEVVEELVESGRKTNFDNETPRSRREWEEFLKDQYGAENVVWESRSGRPTWRQSELDAASYFPDYGDQRSFINGSEVKYGTKGSVRPDYYKEGYSVDIKNYNVESANGRSNLARNIENQYYQRLDHLPEGTKQSIMIDVRGQSFTDADLGDLYDDIMRRTNYGVEIIFKMD